MRFPVDDVVRIYNVTERILISFRRRSSEGVCQSRRPRVYVIKSTTGKRITHGSLSCDS